MIQPYFILQGNLRGSYINRGSCINRGSFTSKKVRGFVVVVELEGPSVLRTERPDSYLGVPSSPSGVKSLPFVRGSPSWCVGSSVPNNYPGEGEDSSTDSGTTSQETSVSDP